MKKEVIHIYGASGSGTSTLGRYIAEQRHDFFMDTDDYFWEPTDPPYTKKREIEERLRLMKHDMKEHGNVVISGSLVDWGDVLIPTFTLAIRLVTDTLVRIERLKQREYKHFGKRIEPGGDLYENHQEFLAWAAEYDEGDIDMRSRSNHDRWQKQLHCPLLLLDGSKPVEENYSLIISEGVEEY